jgi:hypothetical protein
LYSTANTPINSGSIEVKYQMTMVPSLKTFIFLDLNRPTMKAICSRCVTTGNARIRIT